MTLTADGINNAVEKLPKHYINVVKYLFGDGEFRIQMLDINLKRLETLNASAVASMCVYRSGDYDTDTKFQEYIFDVLKKGALEKTILDSPRSLLKTEIQRAFKVPDFLNRCTDFGLDTSDKIADLLLGSAKSAPLEQTVLRNIFVQTHVSMILLMLANELNQPLSKENIKLYRATKRPITGHEIKVLCSDFWNRYKYIVLIVFGFNLLAYGGTQGLSLLSEPSIYLPFSDIQESNLSPKNLTLFKLFLSTIFGFMLYLIIGHKFHFFVQPDRKTNTETQKHTKKVVPAFYILFLFYLSSPVIDFIDSFSKSESPIESHVDNRNYKEAEKLVNQNNKWTKEQKDFVLAQLTIKQRYEIPKVEYQSKLEQHSKSIIKEYELGRYSSEYAQSYGVKQILDANHIENDLTTYDLHRMVFLIWLLVLAYCFVALAIEVDYFGIRKNRENKHEPKISNISGTENIKV